MFRPPAAQARANTFAEESTPLPWGPPIIHERSFTVLTELIGPTLRHARRRGPSWNFPNSSRGNRDDPRDTREGRMHPLTNLSSRFHLRGFGRIVYGGGGDDVSSCGAGPRGRTSCCMNPSMNWNRFRKVTSLTPAIFAIAFCGRRSPDAREARYIAAAAVPEGDRDMELSIFSNSLRILWASASTAFESPSREQKRLT